MRLLLTVARSTEVETALAAGADLVDVKDPTRGSLGRPSRSLLEEVADACRGRCPVSVPLGDGPHDPDRLGRWAELALRVRPAYLKVGLAAPDAPREQGLDAASARIGAAASDARLVAVTFADAPPDVAPSPEELVELAHRHGADGVMLDTLGKDGAATPDLLGRRRLERWAASARAAGLEAGLAGGLDAEAIRRLEGLQLDVVGVRGGACSGGRASRLDPGRCRAVRRAVDVASRPAVPRRRPGGGPAGVG